MHHIHAHTIRKVKISLDFLTTKTIGAYHNMTVETNDHIHANIQQEFKILAEL